MAPLIAQRSRTDRSFERLYRKHVRDVYRYSLAVLRNPADAEDATQTTFLNAYRAFQSGARPDKPQNWLIAIAHNVCRARFRHASRRPQEVALEEQIATAAPEGDRHALEDLRRALDQLGFNQRSALVMRELEGRSYAEIAQILEISVPAVETLLFRARRTLREHLEEPLGCEDATLAISKDLDGALARAERGRLRAHLRTCGDCSRAARSERARRSALKGLVGVPLPPSLGSFSGGGGAAVIATAARRGLALKAAVLGGGTAILIGAGVGAKQGLVPWDAAPAARASSMPKVGLENYGASRFYSPGWTFGGKKARSAKPRSSAATVAAGAPRPVNGAPPTRAAEAQARQARRARRGEHGAPPASPPVRPDRPRAAALQSPPAAPLPPPPAPSTPHEPSRAPSPPPPPPPSPPPPPPPAAPPPPPPSSHPPPPPPAEETKKPKKAKKAKKPHPPHPVHPQTPNGPKKPVPPPKEEKPKKREKPATPAPEKPPKPEKPAKPEKPPAGPPASPPPPPQPPTPHPTPPPPGADEDDGGHGKKEKDK